MPNKEYGKKLTAKYGEEFISDLLLVKAEKIPFTEIPKTYGISMSFAREIFFKFFDNKDLENTKWNKKKPSLEQRIKKLEEQVMLLLNKMNNPGQK